jgi:hypothetical protein
MGLVQKLTILVYLPPIVLVDKLPILVYLPPIILVDKLPSLVCLPSNNLGSSKKSYCIVVNAHDYINNAYVI